MIPEAARHEVAAALSRAEREREPIDPVTASWPDLDVEDAYEIQRINVDERLARGAAVRGHKVGLTAKAMQDMLGVDEPDYGHLLHDMFVFEGGTVPSSELCFPRVEVEVGFVLGESLRGPGVSVADVLRATEFVAPALEIIDSRIRDWKITLADTIADNASAARVVLGGNGTPLEQIDVRLVGAVLRRNGEIAATGASGAVLGNPATAVAWLANKVAAFGVSLEAGHVVLPGSCTRAIDVRPGDVIRADLDVMGHVAVRFS